MHRQKIAVVLLLVAAAHGAATQSPGKGAPAPRIPLQVGLTVVTAINQPTGDYESIKRIVALTPDSVHLTYSNEHPKPLGLLEDPPPGPRPLVKLNATRTILRQDLRDSHSYLQQFGPPENVPDYVQGTTAIGVSATVLEDLKKRGSSQLTVYQASTGGMPPIVEPRQPGTVDYKLTGTISRVESADVPVPVLVNGARTNLPAVHAKGTLVYPAEFWLLDDTENPLALRYMIDKDTLTVIAINYPAEMPGKAGAENAGVGGGGAGMQALVAALSQTCRLEVHGIYFDFNEASIRPESDQKLEEIAGALKANAGWTVRIEGHTDSIGGSAYNLSLSKRRADAVKDALVKRYGIAATRLTTDGLGATRPKESNATLEGRARNRRVELVRACGGKEGT
jgi:outer membrane protein OmpA-like peptidoglycan-associated protein